MLPIWADLLQSCCPACDWQRQLKTDQPFQPCNRLTYVYVADPRVQATYVSAPAVSQVTTDLSQLLVSNCMLFFFFWTAPTFFIVQPPASNFSGPLPPIEWVWYICMPHYTIQSLTENELTKASTIKYILCVRSIIDQFLESFLTSPTPMAAAQRPPTPYPSSAAADSALFNPWVYFVYVSGHSLYCKY